MERIAVLMGGRSGEHEVSLASGRAALMHLSRERYERQGVVIGRDGRWSFGEAEPLALPEGLGALLAYAPDAVFLALHGPEGEDGKIQSLLELAGLLYTGSDPYASSLAMNKPMTKAVYRDRGIPVAEDRLVDKHTYADDSAELAATLCRELGERVVLKTPKLGSSVGLRIATGPGEIQVALGDLFAFDDLVLAERFIAGRELTCSVLDNAATGECRALPLVEITPVSEPFFNYKAKYTPGEAKEVCPAPVEAEIAERVSALGLAAHRALGCRGVSRTDFILSEDGGQIVTLETNTIPGLTETSLLPQAAAAAGITFAALLDEMIDDALARGRL